MERNLEQATNEYTILEGTEINAATGKGIKFAMHVLHKYVSERQIEGTIAYIKSLTFTPVYRAEIEWLGEEGRASFDMIITEATKNAVKTDAVEILAAIVEKVQIDKFGFFELLQKTGYVAKNDIFLPQRMQKCFEYLLNPAIFDLLDNVQRKIVLRSIVRLQDNYETKVGYIYNKFPEEVRAGIANDMLEAAVWNSHAKLPGNIVHVKFFAKLIDDPEVINAVLATAMSKASAVEPANVLESEKLKTAMDELMAELTPKIKKPTTEALIMTLKTGMASAFDAVAGDLEDPVIYGELFVAAAGIGKKMNIAMLEKLWEKSGGNIAPEKLSQAFFDAAQPPLLIDPKLMTFIWEKCGKDVSQVHLYKAAPMLADRHTEVFASAVARIENNAERVQVFNTVTKYGFSSNFKSKLEILKACSETLTPDEFYNAFKDAVIGNDANFIGTENEGLGGAIIQTGKPEIIKVLGRLNSTGGNELLHIAARFGTADDFRLSGGTFAAENIGLALGLLTRVYMIGVAHCNNMKPDNTGETPETVILARINKHAKHMENDPRLTILGIGMKKWQAAELAEAGILGEMRGREKALQYALEKYGDNPAYVQLLVTGTMPQVVERVEKPKLLGDDKAKTIDAPPELPPRQ